jgi:pimeloyl-ACP methyl ester carboxylesterase
VRSVWQTAAWVSGMVGAAATGAVVGAFAHSTRAMARRAAAQEEPLGRLPVDRQSTVAADDGVPLVVREVLPAGGAEAEVTVVFVHGFALDSRCWHFQQRDLPGLADPPVRLVLYDQRSHGRSGQSTKSGSTIEQLGRDLDAVLRAVAPTGDVVLVGHSMGGMTIMALAEQRPELFRDRVRGVALMSTSAGDVGSSGLGKTWLSRRNPLPRGLAVLAGVQPELVERTRRLGDQVTWRLVRNLSFGDRDVPPEVVDLMAEMIGATTVRVVTDFLDTLSEHDRRAALAALRRCEVLILAGEADRVTPFSPHAEVLAGELPAARLVKVSGAGHQVMLERPELVTEQLAELVRRACGRCRS